MSIEHNNNNNNLIEEHKLANGVWHVGVYANADVCTPVCLSVYEL